MNINEEYVPGESVIRLPIFLVGTMRSGSTLLAELLGQSPHIAYCPFELKDVWSRVGRIPMASPRTKDVTCPECSDENLRPETKKELSKAFLGRQALLTDKVEGAFFLNKNPHLCNKLRLVNSLYPDARFIWICRDLPQVVASVKRLFAAACHRHGTWHWWPLPGGTTLNRCWNAFHSPGSRPDASPDRVFPGGRAKYIAEYWLEANRAVFDFFQQISEDRCIKIKEEDLVIDPIKHLAILSAKLGIPLFEATKLAQKLDVSRNNEWPNLLQPQEIDDLITFIELKSIEIDRIFMRGSAKKYLGILHSGRQECRHS